MSTEDAIKTSTDELRSLLSDADSVLSKSADAADETVKELRDRLRAALEEGQTRFVHAKEMAREQLETCDTYVRDNPYVAIGAAAVIGALAGLLLGRRD